MKLIFVTGNIDKFNEAKEIIPEIDWEMKKIDIPELQGGPEEVASEKARLAYEKVKKPVIIDDTGLAFNAFNGMPGIYIKHFLNAVKQDGLVKLLEGFDNKSAIAFASIGYCDKDGVKVFLGKCPGKIVQPYSKGYGFGFGWDPVFSPDGYDGTFASIKTEIKNKISHRTRALEKLKKFLDDKYDLA